MVLEQLGYLLVLCSSLERTMTSQLGSASTDLMRSNATARYRCQLWVL